MRIALAAVEQREDMAFALQQVRRIAEQESQKGTDLVVFPEAYFQGFQALTFDYKKDLSVVVAQKGVEIGEIHKICRQFRIAMGLGYYEIERGVIFSSYIVIDREGRTLVNYRRRSKGWKESFACADYREGDAFCTFRLDGKTFGIVVCGDLWEEELLPEIIAVDCDCMLWPVYTDYSQEVWDAEYPEYLKQTAILGMPVALVNAFVAKDEERAKGGAFVAHLGKELQVLPLGAPGILRFEL